MSVARWGSVWGRRATIGPTDATDPFRQLHKKGPALISRPSSVLYTFVQNSMHPHFLFLSCLKRIHVFFAKGIKRIHVKFYELGMHIFTKNSELGMHKSSYR